MKRSIGRYVFVLASFALLVGCEMLDPYVALKPENEKIGGTRVYASIPQDGITGLVESSKVGTVFGSFGGLIGGVVGGLADIAIDFRNTSTMNKLIESIRKETEDYNFRAQFYESLERTLSTVGTIEVAKIEWTGEALSDRQRDAMRRQLTENGLLTLSTKYELGADFQSLSMVTDAVLWLRGREEPAYVATYHYYTPAVTVLTRKEDAAAVWAANRGAVLRAALTEGIVETMRMIQIDMRPQLPIVPPEHYPRFPADSTLSEAPHSALKFVAATYNRYIVRYNDVLYSASTDELFVP